MRGPELRAVADLWKRTGREITARFTGRSMEPTIPSGAEVRLLCGAAATVGDVVAFIRDDHIVLHRVEALSPSAGWVLTRGDAYLFPDPPIIDLSLILGRATSAALQDRHQPLAPAPPGYVRQFVLSICRLLMGRDHPAGAYVVSRLRYLSLFRQRPRTLLSISWPDSPHGT